MIKLLNQCLQSRQQNLATVTSTYIWAVGTFAFYFDTFPALFIINDDDTGLEGLHCILRHLYIPLQINNPLQSYIIQLLLMPALRFVSSVTGTLFP